MVFCGTFVAIFNALVEGSKGLVGPNKYFNATIFIFPIPLPCFNKTKSFMKYNTQSLLYF